MADLADRDLAGRDQADRDLADEDLAEGVSCKDAGFAVFA